ncbi:MAG: arginine repressor [Calditrichaeota bacterium]|nr:arginine repressor [Calditrichota bacterium]
MHNKLLRQAKIKEIVTTQVVSSQEDLLEKLRTEGFEVTQATLSRDLHEMNIIRIPHEEGYKYILHQAENSQAIAHIIGMEIVNVMNNECMVVVKTMPGRAQGVAVYLDRLGDSHILGTVAGDDTIFVVPDNQKNISTIVKQIQGIMAK